MAHFNWHYEKFAMILTHWDRLEESDWYVILYIDKSFIKCMNVMGFIWRVFLQWPFVWPHPWTNEGMIWLRTYIKCLFYLFCCSPNWVVSNSYNHENTDLECIGCGFASAIILSNSGLETVFREDVQCCSYKQESRWEFILNSFNLYYSGTATDTLDFLGVSLSVDMFNALQVWFCWGLDTL